MIDTFCGGWKNMDESYKNIGGAFKLKPDMSTDWQLHLSRFKFMLTKPIALRCACTRFGVFIRFIKGKKDEQDLMFTTSVSIM